MRYFVEVRDWNQRLKQPEERKTKKEEKLSFLVRFLSDGSSPSVFSSIQWYSKEQNTIKNRYPGLFFLEQSLRCLIEHSFDYKSQNKNLSIELKFASIWRIFLVEIFECVINWIDGKALFCLLSANLIEMHRLFHVNKKERDLFLVFGSSNLIYVKIWNCIRITWDGWQFTCLSKKKYLTVELIQ